MNSMMTSVRLGRMSRPTLALRLFCLVLGGASICSRGQTPPAAESNAPTSARVETDFDHDWLFSKGDFAAAVMAAFDDSGWRHVNLPHDWSIEGPFGPEWASGTGFAPGGIGWYRKHFSLDATAKDKLAAIEFDAVYDHAEVWVNGQFVGGRPYGYSSFECDVTPYLKSGSGENVIAVRVDHSRFADSRWYTGSGIYRNVRLRLTDKLHLGQWGVSVTTPRVESDSAIVRAETLVDNDSTNTGTFALESEIIGPDGQAVGALRTTGQLDGGTNEAFVQQVTVPRPQLWTLDAPRIYTLRSRLFMDSTLVDETSTPFGIRTFKFDPDHGFSLNGVPLKLKGVCVHHEAGGLGAAVPAKVWERRLRTLKEMGVNAIRTSHNPPAPEFLDLCDRLGLLVKDEAFDEFTPAKNKWVNGRNAGLASHFGYAEDFAEWGVRDIQDMVRRDRNHPSIILWSIGNEIDYANDPFTHPVLGRDYRPGNPPAEELVQRARPLIRAVKELDSTRPVTAALATVAMSDAVGLGEMLDAVGYNYQEPRYAADHAKYPNRVIFGSETSQQFSTWKVARDSDYVAGQFLWTGIDYLGEAGRWPNRGSSAGLLDVCGFKKPLAWFRQSCWSDQPMVYICASGGGGGRFRRSRTEESWNWPSNATITVHCYTTCPEVRLALNGQSLETKHLADAVDGELTWEVPFAAGELTATGYRDGQRACDYALKTAGPASRIELVPDVTQLAADGRDVCHVEFRVVDAQGVRVPNAANEVTFELGGPARMLCTENGDLNGNENYQSLSQKTFHGHGLAILQSTSVGGTITLKATSPGLESAALDVTSNIEH
jgi:beta-galactosidase